ncbi:MAG TPA: hypothetical protein VHN14_18350 [Kofleriaceae bacterium]|jgi:hypothetical protein|nr:hypothetical protein [Kofleriaceae bacterium]
MFYIQDRKSFNAKVQAPYVLAEIRALRSSIFKSSPEVQRALAIAGPVEQKYDLNRADLYLPAIETFCAILDPLSMTILTGTLRRVGYEMFPQYVAIMGIPKASVKEAMGIKDAADLVRLICTSYVEQGVVGSDAGTLTPMVTDSGMSVTDTTFMPCQLQMGVFLGAAKMTGLFRDSALVEKRCRAKGDTVCAYDFIF